MPGYYLPPRYCGIYYFPPTVINISQSAQPQWLPQVSLSVNSTIRDTSSSTILTQTFVNPSKTGAIEKAKYSFPLYDSCAVVAFRCLVGTRLIHGIIREKEEAKVEYNAAVGRGETAGLLEMHTPDVFSTSLGNIPAGETVKVEIEYIMELKHDAEVDGLRFTIPTSIAPRYGDAPSGVGPTTLEGQPISGAIVNEGMKISVKLAMPSNIRSVQSPSHTILMHLGGHVENVSDDLFNPKHALATLSQKSTELGADFVLLVKCAELSFPRALLETHPTIENSKALMVTLVPKFTLPSGPKPEIVFVVDRSGSMNGRMAPLKSALFVFLKSLPIGVKFNICSFGSQCTFLWDRSQPYSADTLEKAQQHVQSMEANYGGTELLPPIKDTVSKRYRDIPLEIMVLTDGEVWNSDDLFEFIQTETSSGDIRVFSLGIGRDVSHALVEGMSRVGGGFTQIVSDEKEGFEGKVVRMLRGGLSAHIKDYRLEWDGRPTEAQMKTKGVPEAPAKTVEKKKISLFNAKAEIEPPISTTKAADRFAHLPVLPVPTVIQAPYKLPQLFPFTRSTAYVILSGDVPSPTSVWLRGTTPSGDELELEIPVQVIPEKSRTIHQLSARKILQELEEGTSYMHSGKYGVEKVKNEGTFMEWIEREGIRMGVTYGVASKWTSFVAVEKKKKTSEKIVEDKGKGEIDNGAEARDDIESTTEVGDDSEGDYEMIEECEPAETEPSEERKSKSRRYAPGGFGAAPFTAPSLPVCRGKVFRSAPQIGVRAPLLASLRGAPAAPAFPASPSSYGVLSGPALIGFTAPVAFGQSLQSSPPPPATSTFGFGSSRDKSDITAETFARSRRAQARIPERGAQVNIPQMQTLEQLPLPASAPGTPHDRAKALITLQAFEGHFPLSTSLSQLLGVSLSVLTAKLDELSSMAIRLEVEGRDKLWATILAIELFESHLRGEMEMWELVVEKAKTWAAGLPGVMEDDVKKLQGLASEVLGGLKA